MTPERIAELRRLREEYRQAQAVMLDATPLPGETNDEWQAACGVNAAARSAWVNALYDCEDQLLATAEREAKLRQDIVIVANNLAMMLATRLSREDGLIADIHADLMKALESKGGES